MSYVKSKVQTVAVVDAISDPVCDRCKTPLEFVFPEADGLNRHPQFVDALTVELSGGYGCYVDESNIVADLCATCAAALYVWLGLPDPRDPATWTCHCGAHIYYYERGREYTLCLACLEAQCDGNCDRQGADA